MRALVCLLLTSYSVVRLPRRLDLVLPERPVRAAGGTRTRARKNKAFLNQFLNRTSSSRYHIPWISCLLATRTAILVRYCSKYSAVVVAALGRLCTPPGTRSLLLLSAATTVFYSECHHPAAGSLFFFWSFVGMYAHAQQTATNHV